MKRVRCNLRRPDGTPWPYGSVVTHVVDRIAAASEQGHGLRLSAEEVRALDWAVIREHGEGGDPDAFRDEPNGAADV